MGGGGAPGGAGGAEANGPLQLPTCVAELMASCSIEGACTTAATDASLPTDVCFASGAHATFSEVRDSRGPVTILRVTNADGSPCYTFERYLVSGEATGYAWKNAVGGLVAEGRSDFYAVPSMSIHCSVGDESRSCNDMPLQGKTSLCCGVNDLGTVYCPPRVGTGACVLGACSAAN